MATIDDTIRSQDDTAAEALGVQEALVAENAALRSSVTLILARVAALERRLGLDSSNSSKPPGSDGLKKLARIRSLRKQKGKKTGGQPGHPGKTLRHSPEPDQTIDHFPRRCAGCGEALGEAAGAGYVARQVFDLPEPTPLMVTERRAHRCRCAGCGTQTLAAFPAAVRAPVQYGGRLAAFVVYLANFQLIPEDRLATLMADLFGVSLSRATTGQMSRSTAESLQGFAEAVRRQILSAPIKHLDETGFRIGGRTKWLHIAATLELTFYRIASKRGDLLSGVNSIVVHDNWKLYHTMAGVEHATNLARRQDMACPPRLIDLITRRYDALVADGIAFHEAQPSLAIKPKKDGSPRCGHPPRRISHNLLLRFLHYKDDVRHFLSNLDVPFTNDQAERDAWMMKLRQKISGGFRSDHGAEDFAVIRTLIGTAKKRGWNIIQTLLQDTQCLIADLSSA